MILNDKDKAAIVNALHPLLALAINSIMYSHDIAKTDDNAEKVTDAVCDFVMEYLEAGSDCE
jgi:hypothetical protein